MVGLYLDDILIFVFRTLFRFIQDWNARSWPIVEGEILNGAQHFGLSREPFFFRSSADDYVKRFVPEWKVKIRYNASRPDESFLSEHDQAIPPAWATRYQD